MLLKLSGVYRVNSNTILKYQNRRKMDVNKLAPTNWVSLREGGK